MSAPTFTPAKFAQRLSGVTATEKAASQGHFSDLCRLDRILFCRFGDNTEQALAE